MSKKAQAAQVAAERVAAQAEELRKLAAVTAQQAGDFEALLLNAARLAAKRADEALMEAGRRREA